MLDAFCSDFPDVIVIITSRHFGEGLPDAGAGFQEVYVQLLSEKEIKDFARNYYKHVRQLRKSKAESRAVEFCTALENSERGRDLAKTPLLLVMLLIVSERRQLPDQRQELYRQCFDVLVDEWPDYRARGGALDSEDCWRPEKISERRAPIFKIALWMQSQQATDGHGQGRARSVSREELRRQLPSSWDERKQDKYLNWLIKTAGLMIAKGSPGEQKLEFTHLIFQEYLAARCLVADWSENDLVASQIFEAHETEQEWWGSAASVGGDSRGRQPKARTAVEICD